MSAPEHTLADARTDAAPQDLGWVPPQGLADGQDGTQVQRRWPRDGSCSVHGCEHVTVAVVHRSGGQGRPPFWQNYCAVHAYDRRVQVGDDTLEWTWEHRHLPARRRR